MGQLKNVEELFRESMRLLDESGIFPVIELLARDNSTVSADVYRKLQRELYWNRKNLRQTVAISQGGIQHALGASISRASRENIEALRGAAKAMAYDLASFTWAGWDEKGIDITPADKFIGAEAARLNWRLAKELNRPAKAHADALWMIGAHQIATSDYVVAAVTFESAIQYARQSGSFAQEHMLIGYQHLAQILAHPGDAQHVAAFDSECASLRDGDDEDAVFFADQLVKVLKFFRARAV